MKKKKYRTLKEMRTDALPPLDLLRAFGGPMLAEVS